MGSEKPRKVDVRLVAATNRDLIDMVEKGTFREDLFYRLNVFPIHMPPLRDRPQDIRSLAEGFLDRFGKENRRPAPRLTKEVLKQLEHYAWPGNVRELFNVLERSAILTTGRDLKLETILPNARTAKAPKTWEQQERRYFEDLLRVTKGKITGDAGAATLAGLAPSTLISRLEKLGMKPAEYRA